MPAGPLLTLAVHEALLAAREAGHAEAEVSLDLGRTQSRVGIGAAHWRWAGADYPYPERCRERTVYHWSGAAFEAVQRYGSALIKLVPTDWGPPTFEIDGIKMLPTARVSPLADAQTKVGYVQPRGKRILDTCGGLGYFAVCALQAGAAEIRSFEKNADVIWVRGLNPWSPETQPELADAARYSLTHADVTQALPALPSASVDAVLHDPPRFGIAGELYSQAFYDQLARVLKPHGRLFHYTGTPNKLTSRRDVPQEVSARLQKAGFRTRIEGDGVVGEKAR
ncbi:class I SAM-dependent methyltransferase [Solimonas variicoloris]|uniref:class I SAM-dependent methyltransferase n=1 Tax=Solimonas variicoloris TaxID=254408 RepID=UPI0003787993|nr:MnmC family methyltransferase [Solimonas variicoloris]